MIKVAMEKERVEPRAVSMYARDWLTVERMAKDQGLTVSAGLRRIVQEWRRLKWMAEAMEQYLRLENAYRLEIITQEEFLSALGLVSLLLQKGGDGHGSDGG